MSCGQCGAVMVAVGQIPRAPSPDRGAHPRAAAMASPRSPIAETPPGCARKGLTPGREDLSPEQEAGHRTKVSEGQEARAHARPRR